MAAQQKESRINESASTQPHPAENAARPSNPRPADPITAPSHKPSPRPSRDSSPASKPSNASRSDHSSTQTRSAPRNNARAHDPITSPRLNPTALSPQPPPSSATPQTRTTSSIGTSNSSTRTQPRGRSVGDAANSPSPALPQAKSPPPSISSRTSSVSSPRQSDSDSELSKPGREHDRDLSAESRMPPPPPNQNQPSSALKIPRGASGHTSKLETVQEGDHSISPTTVSHLPPNADPSKTQPSPSLSGKDTAGNASVKEAERPKDDPQTSNKDSSRASSVQHYAPARTGSHSSLAPSKTRGNKEDVSKHMTVETETVSSIPQASAVADKGAATRSDASGTIRRKQSADTIRPKKERRKANRQPPSIVSGAGSSKADIFEAKVASEIEAEDTDSDETFVYESNPPEPRSRQSRHHSRTPSTTSIQSVNDRRGGVRAIGHLIDSQKPVRNKRSMKFASNSYAGSSMDDDAGDRSPPMTPRTKPNGLGQTHALNVQKDGAQKPSSETESPFSQASKLRSVAGSNGKHSPRAYSPKSLRSPRFKAFSPKEADFTSEYESGRADDERTPLISSGRMPRPRGARHLGEINLRSPDFYDQPRRASSWSGCLMVLFAVALIVLGGTGIFATTTLPLTDVGVLEVQNVLASEQEIMLDLLVRATNANIVTITISHVDLNVFAKSKHVGSERYWRDDRYRKGWKAGAKRRRRGTRSIPFVSAESSHQVSGQTWPWDGVDDGTDPIDDPASDQQTMLLGRVFHLDSSLSYDGSPLRHQSQNSTGELRLEQPGTKTEAGGSARWERVVEHPFDLIVRGILKYELPLRRKALTSSVSARVTVHPEDGLDDGGSMKVVPYSSRQ